MTGRGDASARGGARDASTGQVVQRSDFAPVLVVGGTAGATYRYRVLHHREQLRLRGIPARAIMQWHPDLLDAGLGCGHVILHRVAWDPGVQSLIDQTRNAGGVVLYDIDDLVFEPESTHLHHGLSLLSPEEQALYHDGVRRYRKCLLACDGAIAPTAFLAARIRALGLPAWISRNCVDAEMAALSTSARDVRIAGDDAPGRPIVVGYASGSRTHDRDFAEAAGPALRRVMREREDVVLRLVGPLELGPEWSDLAERVERVPAVDWRALPRVLAGFDLNLAPLEIDNPFCESKSELKWLEASAASVPTVASDTGAFRAAIFAASRETQREAGLLARDEAQWATALRELLDDPARARAMGQAAWQAVQRFGTTRGRAAGYEGLLTQARRELRPEACPPAPPERAADGLRIHVLMPEPPRGSGGHTSIMRLVAALDAAGHSVTVHIDPGANMRYASEAEAAAFMRAHFPRSGCAFRLGRDLAPADVAIATGWTTARAVAYAPNVRTKLYLVQDFEPFFQPLGADWLAAEATYRLGLGHITLGPWLAETLRERYGAMAEPVDFGVNHDIYHPPSRPEAGLPAETALGEWVEGANGAYTAAAAATLGAPPRIVFYGRASTPRRGVALGLEALARVKARRPEVEIVLYGGEEPGLADFDHVHAGVLTQAELAALYRSATCGLALSYTNLSFVPLEMAACGLPVVAVDTEPCAWYQRDGITCALAEPTAESVADTLLRVIDDADLRARLSEGGRAAVAGLSWERNVVRFVDLVEDYAEADLEGGREGRGPLTGPRPELPMDAHLDPAGAADLPLVDEHRDNAPCILRPGSRVGWELRPSLDGLHRVGLRLSAAGALPPRGTLVLRIREHATAPWDLAAASLNARGLPEEGDDDTWTDLLLGPLQGSAGETLHAELSYAAVEDGPRAGDLDAPADTDAIRLLPGWRAFASLPPSGEPSQPSLESDSGARIAPVHGEGFDPVLAGALHRRRRSAAAARIARARLERRPLLSRAIAVWEATTRPLPPVPLRPWAADAAPAAKLWRGVRTYGPLRVLRELGIWRRWRRSTP